jgi:signal recognition particle receptor subunit beta
MVFFNYATMQMAAKIVYYGPGLCGKTTNLHHIYTKTSPGSRGEMVSLETETDRTLFFDLLPIDVGVIGGFKTRLQLYTVPGQVFYNTTRKLVLKGVDGIVFVADSQKAMLEANVESIKNLRENLAEIGTNLDDIPLVIQLNKRDLPNIADVDTMVNALDPERRGEHVESVAASGIGVFETLKLISKLTLRTLRRRMTGDESARPAARSSATFRVQDNSRTMAGATPLPAAASPSFTNAVSASTIAAEAPHEVAEPAAAESFDADATIAAPSIDRRMIMDAPVAEPPSAQEEAAEAEKEEAAAFIPETTVEPEPVSAPAEETPVAETVSTPEVDEAPPPLQQPEAPPAPVTLDDVIAFSSPAESAAADAPEPEPEPEITFPQAEAEPQKPAVEPEVKTVKVRTSVDVMAELEALRKRATNTTPKAPKRDVFADLASLRPKRDVNRTLHLQLPADVLARTKKVRVTLSFEDGDQGAIDTQHHELELSDTSDVQSLSVNLKIDLA